MIGDKREQRRRAEHPRQPVEHPLSAAKSDKPVVREDHLKLPITLTHTQFP